MNTPLDDIFGRFFGRILLENIRIVALFSTFVAVKLQGMGAFFWHGVNFAPEDKAFRRIEQEKKEENGAMILSLSDKQGLEKSTFIP